MIAIAYDFKHSSFLPEHVRVYFFTCVIISTDKRTSVPSLYYCIISIRRLLDALCQLSSHAYDVLTSL